MTIAHRPATSNRAPLEPQRQIGNGNKLPSISLNELRRHNVPDDCWIAIKGRVYNVTSYVPQHPGGDFLMQAAGLDGTHVFITTHPAAVLSVLESPSFSDRYCIGTLEPDPSAVSANRVFNDSFYSDLQGEVEAYFRRTGQPLRDIPAMYVKTAAIWLTIACLWFVALSTSSLTWAFLAGIVNGCHGMCVMHDLNHGGLTGHQPLVRFLNLLSNIGGLPSPVWRHQHQMLHHNDTNGIDDMDVHNYPMLRHTPLDPRLPIHRLQVLYAIPLYCIGGINLTVRYSMAWLRYRNVSRLDWWLTSIGILLHFVMCAGLPAWLTGSVKFGAAMWFVQLLGAGTLLFNIFVVNHLAAELHGHSNSWAKNQVITTMDYATDSLFWTHFTGGLNHQTVHHLFPSISHYHYRELTPILRRVCAKHGVQYHACDTFSQAYIKHLRFLIQMGSG